MRWFTGFWVVATLVTGWVIACWLVFLGDGYVSLLWPFLLAGTSFGAATIQALAQRRMATAGLTSVLTALATPTFYFYLPNLGLLIAGLALLVATAHDRSRGSTPRSRGPTPAQGR